jgi:hypothetical protein
MKKPVFSTRYPIPNTHFLSRPLKSSRGREAFFRGLLS